MTDDRTPDLAAQLAPVREALLAAARSDAAAILDRAEAAAAATVAAGAEAAARIREEARAQGVASGTAAAAASRVQARRAARAEVLKARREAYERLRTAARQDLARLRADPEYPLLRRRMATALTRILGGDARLREGVEGGLIGEVPGRRIDWSLATLADRVVQQVARYLQEEQVPHLPWRGADRQPVDHHEGGRPRREARP